MSDYSKLVSMRIFNLGCIGPEGLEVQLDNMLCLVGSNNAGKTTVLRAYELAAKFAPLATGDRSTRCPPDECPAVEISVHIPEGMASIAERWKEPVGDLRLLKSRWEWWGGGKPDRLTWDPQEGEYSTEKAAGIDAVFASRLPKPLRVEALDSPKEEQEVLLSLVLQDVADRLNATASTANSDLKNAVDHLVATARASIADFQKDVAAAAADVNKQFRQIFPHLSVDLRVDIPDTPLEMAAVLKKGSSVDINERGSTSKWDRQGTGSQRALFWSLLGVRARLEQVKNEKAAAAKAMAKASKAKPSKKPKEEPVDGSVDVKLPGHMLLIDEPETALHPNAIRAARRYLYELAKDDGWQVMLTTHSPFFIDPTEDQTTIVRLERTGEKLVPKTFRSESSGFEGDELEHLKLLLKFDSGLAEMFFGGLPIVVEGDTEFAAFEKVMELNPADYPLETRPLVIRARGKFTILPILKIFRQFKVPFALLHDSDSPKTSKKTKNGAWAANEQIHAQVYQAFADGQQVRYRTSIPNFEEQHGIPSVEKDKPWNASEAVRADRAVAASVRSVLDDLRQPGGDGAVEEPNELAQRVRAWAEANAKDDPRFELPA